MNMTHPDILRAEREGGPSFGAWPSEQVTRQFECICGETVPADDENTFACEICKQARCYHCRGVYNKDICTDDECMTEYNRRTLSNTLLNCAANMVRAHAAMLRKGD